MSAALFRHPDFHPGSVWLCGAGPGDPGLLTLVAAHGIAQADAIVHDALVDERVLGLARPDCLIEYAGKRGGKPSPRQPDICDRVIALARQGLRVLRLKGGDPFMFGRGGEEALTIAAAGIPFRIVPGVTAGIGGLAYAGIPVTNRDTNSAVLFLTGHDASGALPAGLDWAALARGVPVLVLYMALANLAEVTARLIAGGRPPDEPVAVVSDATQASQRVLVTTLGRAAAEVAAARIAAPAIVCVGAVVRLREQIAWWDGVGTLAPALLGAIAEAAE